MYVLFFFKQKTAYEMRISDWSSDVCSSDLRAEQILANERKDQEDDGGHGNGTNGHGTPLRRGSVTGEAGVDRRTSRRVDHHEEGDERRNEKLKQRSEAFKNSQSHPSACRDQRVAQQDGNGHWPHSARNWRDRADMAHCFRGSDIAH